MKPMIFIPNGLMTEENLKLLRDNDICVVEAKEPSKLKFVDPIPCISSRTTIEAAAIGLSRILLNPRAWNDPNGTWDAEGIAKTYVRLLIEGTPLSSEGTREEQEQRIIDDARRCELARIGREEAKAEYAARKAAKAAKVLEASKTPKS